MYKVDLFLFTVKRVLSSHSKKDQIIYVFMTNNGLMQIKSNSECSSGVLCNYFDLH